MLVCKRRRADALKGVVGKLAALKAVLFSTLRGGKSTVRPLVGWEGDSFVASGNIHCTIHCTSRNRHVTMDNGINNISSDSLDKLSAKDKQDLNQFVMQEGVYRVSSSRAYLHLL